MPTYHQKTLEIFNFCIERLVEIANYDRSKLDGEISELHHEIFNTDYYIIGRYQATQWMGTDAFDMIGDIQEYEDSNFGERFTDCSDPEKVVNMWVYIKGEEWIQECIEEAKFKVDHLVRLEVS